MCVNPTIAKRIIVATIALIFAIIACKGLNDHFKLFVGFTLAGITAVTLNQWSAIVTILWGVLQIGLLIPGYIAMIRKPNGNKS